eukprot:TRINITY_DN2734_c0_g1_i1.p1 TRINITY_DN2734_c0_g1~~TRINITY_DN2734_c0_g1_i1.p1  ORF type:complete len:272 (-),score=155.44 TRINITY_DN2734_c0_g1_i1:82-897(-)
MSVVDIDRLPNEVLENIFNVGRFTVKELSQSALVCRKWRRAAGAILTLWFDSGLYKDQSENEILNALLRSSMTANLTVANWIDRQFGLDENKIHRYDERVLRAACHYGDAAYVRWLLERFHFTQENIRNFNSVCVRSAVVNGKVDILAILKEKFEVLGRDDVSTGEFSPVRAAASNGHASMLEYLYSQFNVTTDDLRKLDLWSLRCAIARGHSGVVKVLLEVYGFSEEDVKNFCAMPLKTANAQGKNEVVHLIKEKFNITPESLVLPEISL